MFDGADLKQLSRMQRTQERGCVAVHGLSVFTVRRSRILSRFLKNKYVSRFYFQILKIFRHLSKLLIGKQRLDSLFCSSF